MGLKKLLQSKDTIKFGNSPYSTTAELGASHNSKWNAYDKISVKLKFQTKYKNMVDTHK